MPALAGATVFAANIAAPPTVVAGPAPTTTRLSSSSTQSAYGQPVSFTASVQPSLATGAVTFYDSATPLGAVPLDGGAAVLTTSVLQPGTHAISASYGGDGTFASSTSGVVNQTVMGAGTTTAITSSLNPATTGQSVTFTASVSPSVATGTATFNDGSSALGSITISSGTASLTTAALSVGQHAISATYGGDAHYASSTSPSLTEAVQAPLVVTPALGPSTGGTIVTLTGTHLTGTTSVLFGSSPAMAVSVLGDSVIQATSPPGATGTVDVTVSGPGGSSAVTASDHFTYMTPATGSYQSLQPGRICDTRPSSQNLGFTNQCNNGGTGAPLGPGETRNIQACPYPSGCTLDAVTLNVTALGASVGGYLTAFPSGTARPATSSLSFRPGQARAAAVEVRSSSSGGISLYNATGSVDVIVDLEGTVDHLGGPASGSPGLFHPLSSSRICDTRLSSPFVSVNPCNTSGSNPLLGGQVRNIQVTGQGGVPTAGVSAVAVNATVVDTTASGYLTVWPAANPQPFASNVNWAATAVISNRIVVPVGHGGQISVLSSAGSADLVIDVNGWFGDGTEGPPVGTAFTAVNPVRICDTRPSSQNGSVVYPCNNGGAGAPLGSGQTAVLQVTGGGGPVPAGAQGVVATVTVTNTSAASYLTAWPSDVAQPNTADLNWSASDTVANLVAVKLSSGGQVSLFNQMGTTDVLVDVLGYYS